MALGALPPGFRFHPTDEELVVHYLKRKINGHQIQLGIITEIDLYQFEPWELPSKSELASNDLEWYFFSPRDRKYPNGSRTNRATKAGYWKSTGKDREVNSEMRVVGMKKTLVYYQGRAPTGLRTDWVMHEYRLVADHCQFPSALLDAYGLCRVFKKTGTNDGAGAGASSSQDNPSANNIIPMRNEQTSNMDINSTEGKCDDFEGLGDLSSIPIEECPTNFNNQLGPSSTPCDAVGDIDWTQYLNDEELCRLISNDI